jgi:hypothetical protein
MKTWLQGICAALLFGCGALLFTGCAGGVYTQGTVAYYDYDYYPDWDIYYYPERHVYYWHDGDHWRSGRELPRHYDLHERPHERLHLHSREPWTEHHPQQRGFERPHERR